MVVADRGALARRYVVWIHLHLRAIFAASLLLVAASVFLIARYLPLYADF